MEKIKITQRGGTGNSYSQTVTITITDKDQNSLVKFDIKTSNQKNVGIVVNTSYLNTDKVDYSKK